MMYLYLTLGEYNSNILHFTADGHLCTSQFGTITNTVMSILDYVFWQTQVQISVGNFCRNRIAGHKISLCAIYERL